MAYSVQQGNTTIPLRFLLVLSSDHITGATGKTPTVTILRNDGLGFVSPAGAIVEEGSGWYQLQPNAADASLIGPLTLHATAASCDPSDEEFLVVNFNPSIVATQATPSTTTVSVGDLITQALRRMAVLQAGEVPSAEDMADAFLRFTDWIDALGLEYLTIYQIVRTVFNLTPSKASYQIGPGGDVAIARPVFVDHLMYQDTSVTPTLERPLTVFTKDAWAAIPQKTLTNTLPTGVYWEPTFPTATLSFWMVPTASSLQGVLYVPTAVPVFGATTDLIALPPGYRRMLRDNLAVEMWPEWRDGVPVDQDLLRIAAESLSKIKTANFRMQDVAVDGAVTIRHGRRYSILSDAS